MFTQNVAFQGRGRQKTQLGGWQVVTRDTLQMFMLLLVIFRMMMN